MLSLTEVQYVAPGDIVKEALLVNEVMISFVSDIEK